MSTKLPWHGAKWKSTNYGKESLDHEMGNIIKPRGGGEGGGGGGPNFTKTNIDFGISL